MSLNLNDISRIANLARLSLSPEQSERMLTQLNSFFDIVQQMRAVDTTGIEPLPGVAAPEGTGGAGTDGAGAAGSTAPGARDDHRGH